MAWHGWWLFISTPYFLFISIESPGSFSGIFVPLRSKKLSPMNIQGRIVEIFDAAQVSEKFRKREFVIEYAENPQYPEFVKFELVQDKCDLIDNFREGEDVDVSFNIRGRAWTNQQGVKNYFNSLQAWRIQPAGQAASAPAPKAANQNTPKQAVRQEAAPTNFVGDDDNELPF
jgi:hypothetical protein